MKEIFTLKRNQKEEAPRQKENSPSQATLNFLKQFAACYYAEKELAAAFKNDFILN